MIQNQKYVIDPQEEITCVTAALIQSQEYAENKLENPQIINK